jgi:hypothetical protein
LCFALWEDDYAECVKIINAGDGKIVGYNRFEDGIEEVLENAVGAEDYQFVKEAQLEQINLLLKNK